LQRPLPLQTIERSVAVSDIATRPDPIPACHGACAERSRTPLSFRARGPGPGARHNKVRDGGSSSRSLRERRVPKSRNPSSICRRFRVMEPALSGAERESLRNRYEVIPSERRRVFLVSPDSVGRDLLLDLSRQVSQESLCALCVFAFIFLCHPEESRCFLSGRRGIAA